MSSLCSTIGNGTSFGTNILGERNNRTRTKPHRSLGDVLPHPAECGIESSVAVTFLESSFYTRHKPIPWLNCLPDRIGWNVSGRNPKNHQKSHRSRRSMSMSFQVDSTASTPNLQLDERFTSFGHWGSWDGLQMEPDS